MATDILEDEVVSVTRFLGGTASSAGRREPGRCYQITESAKFVTLTAREAKRVAEAILHDLKSQP